MTPHQAQTTELMDSTALPQNEGNMGKGNAGDFVKCTVEMN